MGCGGGEASSSELAQLDRISRAKKKKKFSNGVQFY